VTDKPRQGRARKKIPVAEMAAILAYADIHDDSAAAKRFNVGTKTIGRRRKAAAEGREPDLAELVQAAKTKAAQRHGDLLASAMEASLKRIIKLVPKATIAEAIQAAEALGGLKIQRDWFDGDATTPGTEAGRKNSAARAPAGRDSGTPGPSSDAPVH
jgi:hypothetical protein